MKSPAFARKIAPLLGVVLMAGGLGCGGCDDPTGSGANGQGKNGGAGADAGPEIPCDNDQCPDGHRCVDGACLEDTCQAQGESLCGAGGDCCPENAECLAGECRAPCDGQRCGLALETCCTGNTQCYGTQCVVLEDPCIGDADCGPGEVCEVDLGVCIDESVLGDCEYVPPPGQFEPLVECRWTIDGVAAQATHDDVVMAPMVGNLTDDNGDGVTDRFDTPEIVFITYDREGDGCCNIPGTLRVVEGRCLDDGSMRTLASLDEVPVDNSGGVALGDLDGDGVMEIVAPAFDPTLDNPQGVVAYRRTADDGSSWEVLWHNTDYPIWDVHSRGGTQVVLTDLDGNGTPEVVVGNVALNGQTGALLWDGLVTSGGAGGIGNNAFMGPVSVAGGLLRDGTSQVMAGNTLYDHEGTPLWTYTFPDDGLGCGGQLPCDGYAGLANFDTDAEGEVVLVRSGDVYVLDDNGDLLRRVTIPVDDCPNNEAGPPTVADFDGDGRAEIGTAAGDFYVVVDLDCTLPLPGECEAEGILWTVPNEDCTSRVTASSVFDFEGDGAAEVIYADETTFRILRGADGAELYVDDTHGSHTRLEMVVIADVDNDGNAEVVVGANNTNGGIPGVSVWGDALDNWVFTRRIWNQHAYHPSGITEEGHITAPDARDFTDSVTNSFRQNIQGEGIFRAPDLVVANALGTCGAGGSVTLDIDVTNAGSRMVGPGLNVAVYEIDDGGGATLLTVVQTTDVIFPGGRTQVSVELTYDASTLLAGITLRAVADDDGTGAGDHNECREDNNSTDTLVQCSFFDG
jgi:hypothetical protein